MNAHRTLALVALVAGAAACDSSKSSGPSNSNQQVVTQLTQLSTRLSASGNPAAGYVSFAAAGLAMGVQPTSVNVATNLSRQAPTDGVSLAVAGAAGAMQATGFQIVLKNAPGMTTDFLMNGGVMWTPDLNQFVVVMSTGTSGNFASSPSATSFSMGTLLTVNPQASWIATGGTMSVSGGTATGGNACPMTITGYTCRLNSFTLGFDITASQAVPHAGNAATGSKTASLGSTTVNGYTITVDYANLPRNQRAVYDDMLRQAR